MINQLIICVLFMATLWMAYRVGVVGRERDSAVKSFQEACNKNLSLYGDLMTARKRAESIPPSPFSNLPTDCPPWSEVNQQELIRFLHHTDTGQGLLQVLQSLEQDQNRRAVLQTDHSEYMCGHAAGFHKCVEFLLSSKPKLTNGQPEATPKDGTQQQADAAPIDPAEHYRA